MHIPKSAFAYNINQMIQADLISKFMRVYFCFRVRLAIKPVSACILKAIRRLLSWGQLPYNKQGVLPTERMKEQAAASSINAQETEGMVSMKFQNTMCLVLTSKSFPLNPVLGQSNL